MAIFDKDFFPTPENVIEKMLEGVAIENKIILEPEAGKGDIMDYCNNHGAKEILFCELNADLAKICEDKGRFMCSDFLQLEAAQVSHIDLIIMNPPFSADEKHILHAFDIAPAGCKIIALANSQTVKNSFSSSRRQLKTLIESYGTGESLGNCFSTAERATGVEVHLIKLQKPGGDYSQEFEGFFMEEEQENEAGPGLMSYNFIRDLVNRYVASVKIFDKQLEAAEQMQKLTTGYFSVNIGMKIENHDKPIQRGTFKKEMQKSAWNFIFSKMNMQKYATKGLKADINKFIEEQHAVPFTMQNIYQMIRMIVSNNGERMNKAIVEAFDRITQHYHENRHNVEGWKTNSHYLLNRRFICPNVVKVGWSEKLAAADFGHSNLEMLEDLIKAISYMNGDDYNELVSFRNFVENRYKLKRDGKYLNDLSYHGHNVLICKNDLEAIQKRQENNPGSEIEDSQTIFGQWQTWTYFKFRCYKKGTVHFEFLDADLWGRFNQAVAKIKGYPLYENAYRKPEPKKPEPKTKKPAEKQGFKATQPNPFKILGTFKLNK